MLQLQILSGKKAGATFATSRFPVQIGRSAMADLCLEDSGVWDRHFEVLRTTEGLSLKTQGDATVTVNDQQVTEAILHNGDLISIGLLKLRFGLTPVQQKSLRLREWLTWIGLAGVCVVEVAVILKLLK